LRWTIGYRYRPVRALIPLTVLAPLGSVLFQFASQSDSALARPIAKGTPSR